MGIVPALDSRLNLGCDLWVHLGNVSPGPALLGVGLFLQMLFKILFPFSVLRRFPFLGLVGCGNSESLLK